MTTGDRIKAKRLERGYTLEELGERVGVGKSTVRKWESGMIANMRQDKIAKLAEALGVSINFILGLTEDEPERVAPPANLVPMPVFRQVPRLGTIACGAPILAQENIESYDMVPDYIKADFTLKCKGDSMINARIYDGDVVCIREQPTAEDGQIAAVRIDGMESEATLKRVRQYPDHIVLEPENPMYRPLVYWGEEMNSVHILGVATHFISAVR